MHSILDQEKLEEFRQKEKLQPFRIKQIYHNIFKNSIIDFDEMTDLPKDLRKKLKENFYIVSLKATDILEWEETTKINFKNKKWHNFETVLMFHWSKIDKEWNIPTWYNKSLNRITICISSQIGCAVGCKFCVTWKLWFIDNLEYTEIVEQLLWANNYIKNKFWKKEDGTWFKIRNVVFMWMWEPFLNYENVKKAIEYMKGQNYLSLSKRHITISTSWIVPWIKKMINDNLDVMLAVSLHSADPKTRAEIMPITQRYPLEELMEVLDEYVKKTKNRIFYEYIMIKDLTDTLEQAKYLAKLLKNRHWHVNLISYNENPVVDYKTPPVENILKFKKYLEEQGITVTTRDIMWREIKWACGQLGYEKVKKI
jgi:23S rRNA (adenine2503-C2)-methyltransferase